MRQRNGLSSYKRIYKAMPETWHPHAPRNGNITMHRDAAPNGGSTRVALA